MKLEPVPGRWSPPASILLVLVTTLLSACGLSIPTDPDGTLDAVRRDGVLRVGASPSPGWVEVGDDDPTGREPELVEDFAHHLGASVEWTVAGEEHLVEMLEKGELDLVVGGLTDQNPWTAEAAPTRPYTEERTADGTKAHVMLVPMGENAFQSELERWLDGAAS
ncbi:transporter substrate-binding domain-containing protein [Nocardioides sp. ChNu-153]|uniref:transporter substrate-binding domain-containing protein n=1 Tax=unclassified Nocardioides TaxID=2615069 RepID=UPI00240772B8|nr:MULTISPECIES: transporter substrate-binding domain-containing protein [unclassified Nocardioides]MDF9717646.1 transporter substrate-binding domain-containing protein [Nocardioides sp. ChNu-99]MDN7120774.1 transporter substrate-binding domain-containing protein [Nocardioides sp. ChNu-153]